MSSNFASKRKGSEYERSEIAKKGLFRFEAKRNVLYAKRENTKQKIPKISLIFFQKQSYSANPITNVLLLMASPSCLVFSLLSFVSLEGGGGRGWGW